MLGYCSNILGSLIMYEVQTYTFCDGYVNTWQNADDTPRQYATRKQAMADLRDYFVDNRAAVDDGEILDFENDLIIVRVELCP